MSSPCLPWLTLLLPVAASIHLACSFQAAQHLLLGCRGLKGVVWWREEISWPAIPAASRSAGGKLAAPWPPPSGPFLVLLGLPFLPSPLAQVSRASDCDVHSSVVLLAIHLALSVVFFFFQKKTKSDPRKEKNPSL